MPKTQPERRSGLKTKGFLASFGNLSLLGKASRLTWLAFHGARLLHWLFLACELGPGLLAVALPKAGCGAGTRCAAAGRLSAGRASLLVALVRGAFWFKVLLRALVGGAFWFKVWLRGFLIPAREVV
jgi:hypothetical protein